MTDNSLPPTPNPQKDGDDEEAHAARIDPESYRYWKQVVAKMPPMTPEEIAAVGAILRRIDARVAAQSNQPPRS